jgi:hypothetical protein
MYLEEKPYLKPLPVQNFRFFRQGTRTVDDGGLVQVERGYYAAMPAPLYSEVTVRIYEHEIEILDEHGQVLRRHPKTEKPGDYRLPNEERIFNPSRETARLIGKVAKVGPHCAQLAREIFARLGRPGQHAIYGLSNLTRKHKREAIEKACEQVLTLSTPSYQALRRILERQAAKEEASAAAARPLLQQSGPGIRSIQEYQAFWEEYSGQTPTDPSPTHNDRKEDDVNVNP